MKIWIRSFNLRFCFLFGIDGRKSFLFLLPWNHLNFCLILQENVVARGQEDASAAQNKFCSRFDGLRFIETLVTAHRWCLALLWTAVGELVYLLVHIFLYLLLLSESIEIFNIDLRWSSKTMDWFSWEILNCVFIDGIICLQCSRKCYHLRLLFWVNEWGSGKEEKYHFYETIRLFS